MGIDPYGVLSKEVVGADAYIRPRDGEPVPYGGGNGGAGHKEKNEGNLLEGRKV